MANYVKITDFAAKDSLPTGNPNKVASGTQVDAEFEAIETAIATKEDTANKGIANGYAELDSGGDVPDGQIPTTIPRLSLANIFTDYQSISSTDPRISLRETDVGADAKNWLIRITGGQFVVSTATDAAPQTPVSNWVVVARSGTTIGLVALAGTALTFNGSTVWHAGNDGSGSGLDADTLDGSHASTFATTNASSLTSGTLANARVAESNVTQHANAVAGAISGGTSIQGNTRNISVKAGTTKTLSTSAPSGGSDGDIWYRY
jgi:hypothetical protein